MFPCKKENPTHLRMKNSYASCTNQSNCKICHWLIPSLLDYQCVYIDWMLAYFMWFLDVVGDVVSIRCKMALLALHGILLWELLKIYKYMYYMIVSKVSIKCSVKTANSYLLSSGTMLCIFLSHLLSYCSMVHLYYLRTLACYLRMLKYYDSIFQLHWHLRDHYVCDNHGSQKKALDSLELEF